MAKPYPDPVPEKQYSAACEPEPFAPADAAAAAAAYVPHCLRCPDTELRFIDRGSFAVSPEIISLPQTAIRDTTLTVELWVCPVCRRVELRYPEEARLPETPEEQRMRQLEMRMNQYAADKLRRMAADLRLKPEEREAADRVLASRQG